MIRWNVPVGRTFLSAFRRRTRRRNRCAKNRVEHDPLVNPPAPPPTSYTSRRNHPPAYPSPPHPPFPPQPAPLQSHPPMLWRYPQTVSPPPRSDSCPP